MNPGIHDGIPAADYHADPADDVHPSLTASIANILLTRSPLHAWTAHPKLNPNFEPDDGDGKFDVGTVAHSLLLEGMSAMEVLAFDNYRTKEAQAQRDTVRAAGRIPLLVKQADEVVAMCHAVAEQLQAFSDPVPLTGGKPEQTMVWTDPVGGLCRARVDWLHNNSIAVDDLKTTTRSAHPEAWARNLYNFGCDVQAAFYLRGLEELTGRRPEWRWIVVETAPPFALSVVEPSPAMVELADAKVDAAMRLWAECLESGRWPGYPARVATAELPAWEEARWLSREDVNA